jgi:hypothetical protein
VSTHTTTVMILSQIHLTTNISFQRDWENHVVEYIPCPTWLKSIQRSRNGVVP